VVQYAYELAIGGETVSPEVWAALLASKSELVQFRGQWMQIDRTGMAEVLRLLEQPGEREMPLAELLQRAAGAEEEGIEVACDAALTEMLERLRDPGGFALTDPPPSFVGTLRGYQQRGLSWLHYLEHTGLGMCLADDMGLGKTVQVIALLLMERHDAPDLHPGPTLLIAPTSVLGNWEHELRKFGPALTVHRYHGRNRTAVLKDVMRRNLQRGETLRDGGYRELLQPKVKGSLLAA
jgi:hypothetical protein